MYLNLFASVVAVSIAVTTAGAADQASDQRTSQEAGVTNHPPSAKSSIMKELESLREPVQGKATECKQELETAEAEVKKATELRDLALGQLTLSMTRVEYTESILRDMCSSICIDGVRYTKEDVAAAAANLIVEYRAAKQILSLRDETLSQRITTASKVEVKVAKWQKAERDLLREIGLLKAEHNRFLSGNADKSDPEQTEPSIVRSERLLQEITKLLPKENTVLDVKVGKPVDDESVKSSAQQNDTLLQEVDAVLNGDLELSKAR